jgi:hypothetical protein
LVVKESYRFFCAHKRLLYVIGIIFADGKNSYTEKYATKLRKKNDICKFSAEKIVFAKQIEISAENI